MLILLVILSSLLNAGQTEYDEYRYKVIKAEQDYLAHINALPLNAPAATFEKYRQEMVTQQTQARADYDMVLSKEMNAKIDSVLGKTTKDNSGISASTNSKKLSKSAETKVLKKPSSVEASKEEVEVDGMILLRGGKIRERKIDAPTNTGDFKSSGAEEISFGKKSP